MRGNRGEDPTEGHRSRPYPHPAISHEPRIEQLFGDLRRAGYHPFHSPCGILLDEADRARSTCIRCTWCDGYPCLVHAKADAEVMTIRPLLERPNVTLLVDAEVLRLETDGTGRAVTRVVVSRAGGTEEYAADVVVLAAGATNTAKILLRSAGDAHPNGLANGSDQVGPQLHVPQQPRRDRAVEGAERDRLPEDPGHQRLLPRRPSGTSGRSGNIQMVGKSQPAMYRAERPKMTMLAPDFGLEEFSKHAVDFWLTTEDLPLPENRVTVDGDGAVHLAYRSTNDHEADWLYGELKTILNHAGMAEHHVLDKNYYLQQDIGIAGVGHQAGTCRFGTDPATSVLDPDCKAHELDNLYVVDTSFFPSIGAVNPALTAIANAIRVGEHLAARMA